MIVIGWVLGILIYLIIGNVVIRFFNEQGILNIKDDDEFAIFLLGMCFPIILIFYIITEISAFIYNHLFK